MNFDTQKFLIVGISKSGVSSATYLLEKGAECYLYEELDMPKIKNSIKLLVEKGAKEVSQEEIEKIIEIIDVVVLSPGVPINHFIPLKAKKMGKKITGELELGVQFLTAPSIAVTGTNGKTTTVSMINAVLNNGNKKSVCVGNVGTPITSVKFKNNEIAVIEVSSFQLETLNFFRPHIGVVLNVAPDHLERHYTMENYIYLKNRLLKNLSESEYAVLNYDDETVKEFSNALKAKVVWFSMKEKVDGAYLQDGELYYKNNKIINQKDLSLSNDFNVANALATICVCKIMGIKTEIIANSLSSFKGVKHRLETVEEVKGVTYINDSKATNAEAAISAVSEMKKPTVLIIGGKGKNESYDKLFEKIAKSKVVHTIIVGESRFVMLESATKVGLKSVTVSDDFSIGVKIASLIAKEGYNVLLSPAAASFDYFSSFEERGETFCKLVKELKNEKKVFSEQEDE